MSARLPGQTDVRCVDCGRDYLRVPRDDDDRYGRCSSCGGSLKIRDAHPLSMAERRRLKALAELQQFTA